MRFLVTLFTICLGTSLTSSFAAGLERIVVSANKSGFVLEKSGRSFQPWGVNYDHDEAGRLLEDYWLTEWPKVEQDFREMRDLKCNVVRLHIQFAKFMEAPGRANAQSLAQLKKVLDLAEKESLYIDLTGLGCYHKQDVPAWYDALSEKERWQQQVVFWEAVARVIAHHPALFCYDLMNEPIVRAGPMKPNEWLGPAFGDKYFVQYISEEAKGRSREEVAIEWIRTLKQAIRKYDRTTLITVGLVDWSLNKPRTLYSGFAPDRVGPELDFIAVHLYPETSKWQEQIEVLKAFNVGKPVVVEETFALKCSLKDFELFQKAAAPHADGWISFYWGRTREEMKESKEFKDALMLQWLNYFVEKGP